MGRLCDAVGVVLRADRASVLVEAPGTAAGAVRLSWGGGLLAAVAADPGAAPCTGDVVTWRTWPDGRATAERVHPRRTLLARPGAGRGSRELLAANVDTVAVVQGLLPGPDPDRVARLLALARPSGAEPVVLLTGAGPAPDAELVAAGTAAASGCPVIVLCTVTGEGFGELRGLLAGGRTLALLGASAAATSGMLDLLGGGATGGRRAAGTRELHRVAGGALIDGPALRSAGRADDRAPREVRALRPRLTERGSGPSDEPPVPGVSRR